MNVPETSQQRSSDIEGAHRSGHSHELGDREQLIEADPEAPGRVGVARRGVGTGGEEQPEEEQLRGAAVEDPVAEGVGPEGLGQRLERGETSPTKRMRASTMSGTEPNIAS